MVGVKALIRITCIVLLSIGVARGDIGVNWGSMASHPLNPDIVVQMLKDNGLKKVKLFDADDWTVSALSGTKIEVMLGIPNNQLKKISSSYREAEDWVKENVTRYVHHGDVNIKYVAVGNEPFLKSYHNEFLHTTLPAIKNIQRALNEGGLGGKIKVTCPHNADVYNSPKDNPIPSAGDFRSDIRDLMVEMVRYLNSNDAPFLVNIYPFLSLYDNKDFPVDFAFFEGVNKTLSDKDKQYSNVFDANYDTLVWSLKKAGVPNMKIIVGEVGWPTEGDIYANTALAEKFYNGFIKKMRQNKGTPFRPGPLEVYLFGLFDENQKSIAPGPFERHWGIFQYDGRPKFPVDLSGQGRKSSLVAAKGVEYQTRQWCVIDRQHVRDLRALAGNLNYACAYGDCTALTYGSSCNDLDQVGNASYAYNMFFQIQDQDVRACDFQGTAMITTRDPSLGKCLFPVQIVSAGVRSMLASVYLTIIPVLMMMMMIVLVVL